MVMVMVTAKGDGTSKTPLTEPSRAEQNRADSRDSERVCADAGWTARFGKQAHIRKILPLLLNLDSTPARPEKITPS